MVYCNAIACLVSYRTLYAVMSYSAMLYRNRNTVISYPGCCYNVVGNLISLAEYCSSVSGNLSFIFTKFKQPEGYTH